MSVRVPSGEIRRTCHKGTSGWECPWDLDISTAGKQVILELTTDEAGKEPVLRVELRLDREDAGKVLDLFLAAMVEAGHQK
jgi:hypothetical protein